MIDFFKNGVHLLLTFIYTVLAWIQPRANTFCTEGGAVMLQAHCYHVAIMLLVFCEHGTNMLQVCCQHVESMLSARCQQLQSMLPTFAKHVASMHRACAEHLQIKQPCPAARTEEFSVLFLCILTTNHPFKIISCICWHYSLITQDFELENGIQSLLDRGSSPAVLKSIVEEFSIVVQTKIHCLKPEENLQSWVIFCFFLLKRLKLSKNVCIFVWINAS